jgi:methyl-accepting chemotaxis protein
VVIVQQPSAAAFAPLDALTRQILLLMALASVAAATLSVVLARQITRPLKHLRAVANQVAAGDLTHHVLFTERDEIGDVGRAFDRMSMMLAERTAQVAIHTAQLEQGRAELEARVAARTQELQAANAQLQQTLGERERIEAALRHSQQAEGRLEGVSLAAREMAHLLNNALAMPVGAIDLLQQEPTVPPRLRRMVDQAATSLQDIKRLIKQFQQVVRVETKETIVGPALDLARSVQANGQQTAAEGPRPLASEEAQP